MKHAFTHLDVFITAPLQGKPLAVVCIKGRLQY